MSDDLINNPESRLTDEDESLASNANESLDNFFESYVDATNPNIWLKLLKENIFEKFDTELDELIVKFGSTLDREKLVLRVAGGLIATKIISEIALNISNKNYTPDTFGSILMIMVAGTVIAGLGVHFRGKRTEIKYVIDEDLGVVEWLAKKSKNQERLEDRLPNSEDINFDADDNQSEQEA